MVTMSIQGVALNPDEIKLIRDALLVNFQQLSTLLPEDIKVEGGIRPSTLTLHRDRTFETIKAMDLEGYPFVSDAGGVEAVVMIDGKLLHTAHAMQIRTSIESYCWECSENRHKGSKNTRAANMVTWKALERLRSIVQHGVRVTA